MEGRLFCFLLALQIVSWASATSRPLAPNDGYGLGVHQPATGQGSKSLQVSSSSSKEISLQSFESKESGKAAINEEANASEEESKMGIGSTPPSCEHKCYGCIPCEAIQVPAITSKRGHLGLQYANYEPESWKCKCGPSFYSP